MAELTFESPITKSYPAGSGDLTLSDISHTAKVLVRADVDSPAAQTLAVGFGSLRTEGETIVSGSRPDEWMILGTAEGVASIAGSLDTNGHVSVIDWTHGRAMFRLTGQAASSVLEKVCSLDFSDNMTPDGAVVSASVAKVSCDLARNDVSGSPSYLILCDRSFGQYIFDTIVDAGTEFTISANA